MKRRVAVLISGNGTNLQALIDAAKTKDYPGEIALVISNKPDVHGINRAWDNFIPAYVIEHKGKTRREFEDELIKMMEIYAIDWVCLAGFMRVLTKYFIDNFDGRVLNVHPSLLPRYPGTHALEKALNSNEMVTGATVHYVDEGVDTGRLLIQKACPIELDDSVETLRKRVQKIEHEIYPKALKLALLAEQEKI